jgi:hypothetical protein
MINIILILLFITLLLYSFKIIDVILLYGIITLLYITKSNYESYTNKLS